LIIELILMTIVIVLHVYPLKRRISGCWYESASARFYQV